MPFPNLPTGSMIVSMLQAPGDSSRWYIVERVGRVLSFANTPTVSTTSVVMDIQSQVAITNNGGLLDMAFHPDFASNGEVFLAYIRLGAPHSHVISRMLSPDGGVTINPATEEILIEVPGVSDHGGGRMDFGDDGYLYVSIGDFGKAFKAQQTGNLYGTMIRIDVSSGVGYGVPPDNPFVSGGGLPEVYAYGFRNPWRWNFDRVTDDLYLGDVGRRCWEEIDLVVSGGNYGWHIREGAHCRPLTQSNCTEPACNSAGLIDPDPRVQPRLRQRGHWRLRLSWLGDPGACRDLRLRRLFDR